MSDKRARALRIDDYGVRTRLCLPTGIAVSTAAAAGEMEDHNGQQDEAKQKPKPITFQAPTPGAAVDAA